ncbi:MAG: LicD family protein [Blautia sp.]|nr:LicD family protein [Blautia sp.]
MIDNLKMLQTKELTLLKELRRVCNKNDIPFFLAYGTLLGAVRHQGFIPWDDDIDVAMSYPDYVRFREVCRTQLGPDFFLQTEESDPEAGLSFYKLRLNHTTLIIDSLADRDIHHGISIDIYPLYHVPDNPLLRWLQLAASALYMLFAAGRAPSSHGKKLFLAGRLLLGLFRGRFRAAVKKGCHNTMAAFEQSPTKYRALLFGNLEVCRKRYPSEIFSQTCQLLFEGEKYPAPIGYDRFLRLRYGNYMSPPPASQRTEKLSHIVKFDPDQSYLKYKGILYCRDPGKNDIMKKERRQR